MGVPGDNSEVSLFSRTRKKVNEIVLNLNWQNLPNGVASPLREWTERRAGKAGPGLLEHPDSDPRRRRPVWLGRKRVWLYSLGRKTNVCLHCNGGHGREGGSASLDYAFQKYKEPY